VKQRLALGVLLLVACSDPTVPARTSTYGFDFAGDVFHWTQSRLPVRYYADTRGNMRDLVEHAIGSWENQVLYGEFTGELVADSTSADVIVTWFDSIPPDVPPDTGPPVFACDGVTRLQLDSAGTALSEPIRTQIRITTAQAYTPAQVSACLRRVTIHELGHTLGLLQESPAQADIMYSTVQVSAPSGRDRQTVQVLYHTPPTIAPPPRRPAD
jgi:predicted Zn-dependent protease